MDTAVFEQRAVELLDRLEKLAVDYAPDAMDAALGSISVSGVGSLLYGVLGIICAVVATWMAINFTRFCMRKKQEDGLLSNWEIGVTVTFIVGGFTSVCIAVVGVIQIFNIWNWVAIFNPKLALVHRLLGL